MTGKTDALVALIEAAKAATEERMHDGASSRESCDRLVAAIQPAEQALAEQPAEAVAWLGVNHRTGEPEISTHKPASSVMRDFNMRPLVYAGATPPAASVDVEGLRALADEMRGAERPRDYVQSAWVKDWANRIRKLIDSAGGANGCTCPSGDGSLRWPCPSHSAPQPDGD